MQRAFQLGIHAIFAPFVQGSMLYIFRNIKQVIDIVICLYVFQISTINEEVLVAFCFFTAVGYIYFGVRDSVTESLNERSDAIRKDLSTFLILKQENIQELIQNEDRFLKTTRNIHAMHNYCSIHLKSLKDGQQTTFNRLVSKDINARILALYNIQKSSQPVIHKLMHDSFRQTVYAKLTRASREVKGRIITGCFKKLRSL